MIDAVNTWSTRARQLPELRFINRYHDDEGYIGALAARVRAHWQAHGRGEHLVMSFHGVPERTLRLGDPYHCECHKNGRLLAQKLGLATADYTVSFQSRFGKAKWLEPYTEPTLQALAGRGIKRVDVFCPGFTADCLETLEEIGMEGKEAFLTAGGTHYEAIACLNDHEPWIEAMAALCEQHMAGWPTRQTPEASALQASREAALAMGASD